MSDLKEKQVYPEWLTAKVKVYQLPTLDSSLIDRWDDYIDNIKLEHLRGIQQAKFTDVHGRIGIVKQHQGRVMTIFKRYLGGNGWYWTLQQPNGKQEGCGSLDQDQFEWKDEAQFPDWLNLYFNDKLKYIPVINVANPTTKVDWIDFIPLERMGEDRVKQFVDSFGRPGLVKNNQNGTLSTMFQRYTVTPSEWVSLTYEPPATGNEHGDDFRNLENLLPWKEAVAYQLFQTNNTLFLK